MLETSLKYSGIKLTERQKSLISSLISAGYTDIGWSDNNHWEKPKSKEWKKNDDYKNLISRKKYNQQQIDILFGKKYLSFYKGNSKQPGFWTIDPEEIPNVIKDKTPKYSCDVPFWERPENTIRWKVSEGKDSFAYIARVYSGNTHVKTFFGPEALENANDFIEKQEAVYHSHISSSFNIKQEVLRYEVNEWHEFNTRELAERFAREAGYKMPIYKSF